MRRISSGVSGRRERRKGKDRAVWIGEGLQIMRVESSLGFWLAGRFYIGAALFGGCVSGMAVYCFCVCWRR